MKRLLLSFLLVGVITNAFLCSALTVDAKTISRVDAYVINQNCSLQLELLLDDLEIEKGIISFSNGFQLLNSPDYEKYLYCVYNDDTIVATYIVTDLDGELSGYLSTLWANSLDFLYKERKQDFSNMTLYADNENETVLCIIGNNEYDLNTITVSTRQHYPGTENRLLSEQKNNITRYPTSYSRSWTSYQSQSGGTECFRYCSFNVYKNMGGSAYNWNDFYSAYPSAFINQAHCTSYLSHFFSNFTCYYGQNVTDGFLSFSTVSDIIYYTGYITIMANGYGSSGHIYHAMVIRGYVNNGTATEYYIWDPYGNVSGYMNSYYRTFVSQAGATIKWENGYVYNYSL